MLPWMQVPSIRGTCVVGRWMAVLLQTSCKALKGSCMTGLSSQQLMEKGRKEMKAQDDSLIRAQRIVESTIEVGRPQPDASCLRHGRSYCIIIVLCRSRCSRLDNNLGKLILYD